MNKESHELIESLFAEMLLFLGERGLQNIHAKVAHYVDAGEYGLAFEATLDGCVKWGREIPERTQEVFEKMVRAMEMDDAVLDVLTKRF